MPGIQHEARGPYLSIIEGKLKQKVDKDTNGAIRRDYEIKKGKEVVKGTKYELEFDAWVGIMKDLTIRDTDYGEQLSITFDDAILTIGVSSSYFTDFVKKIMTADVNKPIKISPYNFEDDGQKRIGVALYQNEKKLENFYYNPKDKKSCNGMPVPKGDTKKFKTNDWKVYYIEVEKFLVAELEKIQAKVEARNEALAEEEAKEAAQVTTAEDAQEMANEGAVADVPIDTTSKPQDDKDDIKLEDIPF